MIEFYGMGFFVVFFSCIFILVVFLVVGFFIFEYEKLFLCCVYLIVFGYIFYVIGCNYYQFDC